MTLRRCRRALVAALVVALCASVSACGEAKQHASRPRTAGPSPSASITAAIEQFAAQSLPEILRAGVTQQRRASSVRLDGTAKVDGKDSHVTFTASRAGACTGSLEFGRRRIDVRRARRDSAWLLKMNAAAWPQWAGAPIDSRTARYVDHWLKVPAGTVNERLVRLCDTKALWRGFRLSARDAKACQERQDVVADETAVWIACETVRVWVRATEPHYILKLDVLGADPVSITFGNFDGPLDLDMPAADAVIDLTRGLVTS